MKTKPFIDDFGKRLASLRKQRGLTQTQLGEKIGVSYRVIAYYEGETKYPPSHLLVPLAKALRTSTDELFGIKNIKEELNPEYASLWRKFKKAEILSLKDRKTLLDLLNALVAKSQNSAAKDLLPINTRPRLKPRKPLKIN